MLWHPHYGPKHQSGLPALPPFDAELDPVCLVGSFGLSAIRDCGVWVRLISEAFPAASNLIRFVVSDPPGTVSEADLGNVLPPSLLRISKLYQDSGGEWRALIRPDREDRGFAALVSSGRIHELMVGPPNEDAWDHFRERYRAQMLRI